MYPQEAANLIKLILYNSRSPRPSEKEGVDYYFKNRAEIEAFRKNENFIVMEVRDDLQAIDVQDLLKQLQKTDVLYEGNTFLAKILLTHNKLKDIKKLGIFISPFSKNEIEKYKIDLGTKGFENYVFNIMKSKLLRRAEKFNMELSDTVLSNIDKRAADAYLELSDAGMFDYVIPNHNGEGSDNWEEPIPGNSDAYLAVKEFSLLLKNKKPNISEKWN